MPSDMRCRRALNSFRTDRVILEPAFFSEMLGLQGRMDLMQSDYRVLLEQKSGKGAFAPGGDPSVPKHVRKHYVQLLLYMAIIRYNYRARFEANDRRLSAFPDVLKICRTPRRTRH